MRLFNKLTYYVLPQFPDGYSVPEWLSIELGIFAGRLYIDFAECACLRTYLQSPVKRSADTSLESGSRIGIRAVNPLGFLLEWLTIRRKGQDITHTPMGYICQDRTLHETHPFFLTASRESTDMTVRSKGNHSYVDVETEDSGVEDELDLIDQMHIAEENEDAGD